MQHDPIAQIPHLEAPLSFLMNDGTRVSGPTWTIRVYLIRAFYSHKPF